MAGIQLSGAANLVEADANNQLLIRPGVTPATMGGVLITSENDAGSISGTRFGLSPETSQDYRLRVGLDAFLDNETFNYTSQNTAKHTYTFTTLTMDLNAQSLRTNALGVTTINTAAKLSTFQFFPLLGGQTATVMEFTLALTAALTTNTTIDVGLVAFGAGSPYVPADGVFLRITSAGFSLIINYNGADVATSLTSFAHTINRAYQFQIVITEQEARLWIDDVLYATLAVPTTQGQPLMSASAPFGIRHAIGGTAAGAVINARIYDMSVQLMDVGGSHLWPLQCVGMGQAFFNAQQGATQGQTATYTAGAAPGAVTLTANTAPATNTLGGLFVLPAVVTTGESDYPLFAWQNPAGTTTVPGRTFICTGVIVAETFVSVALTGGPIVLCFALGVGSTNSSLATAESASFTTATAKIARKFPIGAQAFAATAAIGTLAAGFQRAFPEGLPVQPGEFLHIILRAIGTSTSAGTIRGGITPIGYWK